MVYFHHLTLFFRRKNTAENKYPKYTFILAFGNVLYQIIIPDDEEISEGNYNVTLLKFMTPYDIDWFLGDPSYRMLDWSSCEVLKDKEESITFSYDEKIKIDSDVIDKDSIKI